MQINLRPLLEFCGVNATQLEVCTKKHKAFFIDMSNYSVLLSRLQSFVRFCAFSFYTDEPYLMPSGYVLGVSTWVQIMVVIDASLPYPKVPMMMDLRLLNRRKQSPQTGPLLQMIH